LHKNLKRTIKKENDENQKRSRMKDEQRIPPPKKAQKNEKKE